MNSTLYFRKSDEENADLSIHVRPTENGETYVSFRQRIAHYANTFADEKLRWLYMNNEIDVLLSRERLIELRDKIDEVLAANQVIEGEWSEPNPEQAESRLEAKL